MSLLTKRKPLNDPMENNADTNATNYVLLSLTYLLSGVEIHIIDASLVPW
jgi:hypothetical protein